MKFRDPKTGEVFEDIEAALVEFCWDNNCPECPLHNRHMDGTTPCSLWCEAHPAEAARLMGLEVMEDSKVVEIGQFKPIEIDRVKEAVMDNQSTMGQANQPEQSTRPRINWDKIGPEAAVWCKTEDEAKQLLSEADRIGCKWYSGSSLKGKTLWHVNGEDTTYSGFDGTGVAYGNRRTTEHSIIPFAELLEPVKPRICEVLGVEVGEVFSVRMDNGEVRRFMAHGIRLHHVREDGSMGNRANAMSLWLLEHPDRIIRKPRFTEEEVAALRALHKAGAKYVVRERVLNRWLTTKPEWSESMGMFTVPNGVSYQTGELPDGMFPSLRPGQAVPLSDITGECP